MRMSFLSLEQAVHDNISHTKMVAEQSLVRDRTMLQSHIKGGSRSGYSNNIQARYSGLVLKRGTISLDAGPFEAHCTRLPPH